MDSLIAYPSLIDWLNVFAQSTILMQRYHSAKERLKFTQNILIKKLWRAHIRIENISYSLFCQERPIFKKELKESWTNKFIHCNTNSKVYAKMQKYWCKLGYILRQILGYGAQVKKIHGMKKIPIKYLMMNSKIYLKILMNHWKNMMKYGFITIQADFIRFTKNWSELVH